MPQSELRPDGPRDVIKPDVVKRALVRLSTQATNNGLAGYLAVLHTATHQQSYGPLKVPFKAFFEAYFAVSGSIEKYPFYLPFGPARDLSRRFFNRNVAGSYGPSSIREVHPLSKLTTIERTPNGVQFTLHDNHGQTALDILKGEPIPGATLAAYLYRDYGFETGLGPNALYDALHEDFGFAFQDGPLTFDKLFRNDTDQLGADVFEPLES